MKVPEKDVLYLEKDILYLEKWGSDISDIKNLRRDITELHFYFSGKRYNTDNDKTKGGSSL